MSVVITPTPGRVVWFYPAAGSPIPHLPGIPLAATVAWVENDRTVNLSVSDVTGAIWPQQDVPLVQEGDVYESDAARCEWMPYQLAQAKAAAEPAAADAPAPTPAPTPAPAASEKPGLLGTVLNIGKD